MRSDKEIKKRKNHLIARFARAVSYIFDGSVLAAPVFAATSFYNQADSKSVFPSFITAVIFAAFIPYFLILFLYKAKKISDLQIARRKERLFPLLIINICVVAGFFALLYLQPQRLMMSVYSIYLIGLPIISLITLFWKISFHATYITLFSMVFMIVFGKWAVITIPLIPLVGWSRIKLRKHTLPQVIAGISVIGIISLSVFYITGFLTTSYWSVNEISYLFKSTSSYLGLVLPGFGACLVFIFLYVFLKEYIKGKKNKFILFGKTYQLSE
ncbi:MAG: hypothetical protein FJW68_10300 [Actinobacteria bacterium]|nr:hypothetical protein [Actinomycetota bacterium]